jgi:hypothetical protein
MEQPMKGLVLVVAAPFMAACATVEPPDPPYRALVIDLIAIDPHTGAGSFEVAPRELATLSDLETLDGAHLRMFRGGSIRVRQIGPTVVGSGLDHGDPPDLRYDVRGGTITALDYSTLAMLSAYHAYERLFGELPRVLGLSIEQLDSEGAQFAAFFEPETIDETTGTTRSSTAKGNAFYAGDRRWALAQPAQYERVPLVTDLRVLSHEFGHYVFERQFDAGHPATCTPDAAGNADPVFPGRLDAEYAIDGLNEGFADFISFAVTGGINPLADLGGHPGAQPALDVRVGRPDRRRLRPELLLHRHAVRAIAVRCDARARPDPDGARRPRCPVCRGRRSARRGTRPAGRRSPAGPR